MRHMLYLHLGLLTLRRHPKFLSDLKCVWGDWLCARHRNTQSVKARGILFLHNFFFFFTQLEYKFGFYAVFYNSKEVRSDLHILAF